MTDVMPTQAVDLDKVPGQQLSRRRPPSVEIL